MIVSPPIKWPHGKKFAFSIVDDTDCATLENVGPIYRLLSELGLKTTKTVWPLRPNGHTALGGSTLEDKNYREWVLSLRRDKFEIAYHGTTDHPSERVQIIKGLDFYRSVLGENPRIYASHSGQKEAMYWGEQRLNGFTQIIYQSLNSIAKRNVEYSGDDESSPYFWGDICRSRITYTRGFTFNGINTLQADPWMPYHNTQQPYVNWWFSSSDGYVASKFNALLNERNQEALMMQGGCCIVYTHFAFGFCKNGRVDASTRRLLTRLASLDGWFAPASEILNHLRAQSNRRESIRPKDLRALQRRWLYQQLGTQNWTRYAKRLRHYRSKRARS